VRSLRDADGMLASHEIESMRRSHAMAPLSPTHVRELIETCAQLAKEREQIAAVVASLPDSFSEVRAALNELHRILAATQPAR
jgi:DNA-directed RNA polymerase subunit F